MLKRKVRGYVAKLSKDTGDAALPKTTVEGRGSSKDGGKPKENSATEARLLDDSSDDVEPEENSRREPAVKKALSSLRKELEK